MKGFADLADLPEDTRIAIIAKAAVDSQGIIGVVVDDEQKADRYIEKLLKAPDRVRIIDRGPGPVQGSILIRVGPKGH